MIRMPVPSRTHPRPPTGPVAPASLASESPSRSPQHPRPGSSRSGQELPCQLSALWKAGDKREEGVTSTTQPWAVKKEQESKVGACEGQGLEAELGEVGE